MIEHGFIAHFGHWATCDSKVFGRTSSFPELDACMSCPKMTTSSDQNALAHQNDRNIYIRYALIISIAVVRERNKFQFKYQTHHRRIHKRRVIISTADTHAPNTRHSGFRRFCFKTMHQSHSTPNSLVHRTLFGLLCVLFTRSRSSGLNNNSRPIGVPWRLCAYRAHILARIAREFRQSPIAFEPCNSRMHLIRAVNVCLDLN